MDVVLIALYAFWNLEINGLYVEFGAGQNKHWISVHNIAADLGEEGHFLVCLHWMRHSFTISGKRENNWLEGVASIPEVTEAFINCSQFVELSQDDLKLIACCAPL